MEDTDLTLRSYMHPIVFMNKFAIAFVLLSVVSLSALSQEILLERDLKLSKGLGKDKREAYPVVDPATAQIALFIVDNNTIEGNLFSTGFDPITSISTPLPEKNTADLLGCSVVDGKYHLVFSSGNKKRLAIVSFDYSTGNTVTTMTELPLKKESYVASGSYNGKFYVITAMNKSGSINLYTFQGTQYSVNNFDFNAKPISSDSYVTLEDILTERVDPVRFMDNTIPNSIDAVSAKNKMYAYDNKLAVTIDNLMNRTAVIAIDLTTHQGTLDFYLQVIPECNLARSLNSYVYEGRLYQFAVCPQGMNFVIRDLQTGEPIKQFSAGKDDDIVFRNSPIMQEGSQYAPNGERELSKTKQFLRKVSSGNAGVSAYRTADSTLQVTLGSFQEVQTNSGGGFGVGFGGPGLSIGIGTGVNPMFGYNPTMLGYNGYRYSKSVYFKSVLTADSFEHKPGGVPPNAFDKIRDFSKNMDDLIAETLFKIGDVYLYGYYLRKEEKYVIRGFVD